MANYAFLNSKLCTPAIAQSINIAFQKKIDSFWRALFCGQFRSFLGVYIIRQLFPTVVCSNVMFIAFCILATFNGNNIRSACIYIIISLWCFLFFFCRFSNYSNRGTPIALYIYGKHVGLVLQRLTQHGNNILQHSECISNAVKKVDLFYIFYCIFSSLYCFFYIFFVDF